MSKIVLTDNISIIPIVHVQSISNNTVTPKTGKQIDTLPTTSEIKFEETSTNKNGNTLYNQNMQTVTDKLSQTLRDKYPAGRQVIVILYKNDLNTPLVIGNLEQPAYISIEPKLNSDSLVIERQSTAPVL